MTSKDVLIELTDLRFRYQSNDFDTLHNISLTISAGECIGLIGPNGAGKSTLISLITGLLQPTAGSLFYQQSEAQQAFIKQYLALVPQEYAFYEKLTVMQNLDYFASLLTNIDEKSIVEKALTKCQLDAVATKKAQHLSGGYKRRLNLAIALLKHPKVLILDEPTVGIDPISRELILTLLADLKQQGTTIIYTSHLLSEVEQICDRIYGLKRGELININTIGDNAPLQISFAETINNSTFSEISALIPNVVKTGDSQLTIERCKEPLFILAQLNQLSLPTICEINFSTLHLENYYKELFTEQ